MFALAEVYSYKQQNQPHIYCSYRERLSNKRRNQTVEKANDSSYLNPMEHILDAIGRTLSS